MTAKLIAVANMKGGVGKTTTVVSLAETLAAVAQRSVLVVDVDPQTNASVCIAGENLMMNMLNAEHSLDRFLRKRLIEKLEVPISDFIRTYVSLTTWRGKQLKLSLLPSSARLRVLERELMHTVGKDLDKQMIQLFSTVFKKAKLKFDYVIFDCAPGLSPSTEAAIRISDIVIVPTIPDTLSTFGLNAFHESIWVQTFGLPKPQRLPYVLINRFQSNVRQQKEVVQELQAEKGKWFHLLDHHIEQRAQLSEAVRYDDGLNSKTYLGKYGDVAHDFLVPLANEIEEILS